MEYKVIPFTAILNPRDTADVVSVQLEKIIDQYNMDGWKYVRLESVSTYVNGAPGCFGVGSTPGFMKSYQMIVFQR